MKDVPELTPLAQSCFASMGNGSEALGYAAWASANVDMQTLLLINVTLAAAIYFSDMIQPYLSLPGADNKGNLYTLNLRVFEIHLKQINLSRSLPLMLFLINFGVLFVRGVVNASL